MTDKKAQNLLNFWFNELSDADKWMGGEEIDQLLTDRYQHLLDQAKSGELASWRETIQGRVAEVILLDQFSRNIYRGQAEAFSSDDMALALAQEILNHPDYDQLSAEEKQFAAMPFMHSESLYIQKNYALSVFSKPELQESYEYAEGHYEVIKKFGRFPHRNQALGRESTPEELEHIEQTDVF